MAGLSRPSGVFALVALDQRESLRAYLREASGADVPDEAMVAFKQAALKDLLTSASGVLLDLDFGLPALAVFGGEPPPGGLILAADTLAQDGTGAIVATDLDPRVDAGSIGPWRCSALKLLVIWRPGAPDRRGRQDLVTRFMSRCREMGVLGLVEALMDPPTRQLARRPDGAAYYQDMAEEIAAYGPDIYKTEVPGDPGLPAAEITERSAAISSRLNCPWVLLSNGVPPESYPAVVSAVCEGGASGFLAGRAIWRLAISPGGYDPSAGARDRLAELVGIVEQKARPWQSVVGPHSPGAGTAVRQYRRPGPQNKLGRGP